MQSQTFICDRQRDIVVNVTLRETFCIVYFDRNSQSLFGIFMYFNNKVIQLTRSIKCQFLYDKDVLATLYKNEFIVTIF